MKIIFEFDTDSENFDYTELERYKCVDSMAICLNKIADKVRYWYNKDDRTEILTDDFEIINENVNMEKIGY